MIIKNKDLDTIIEALYSASTYELELADSSCNQEVKSDCKQKSKKYLNLRKELLTIKLKEMLNETTSSNKME